jgi:M6 family metalloprotease-like protein
MISPAVRFVWGILLAALALSAVAPSEVRAADTRRILAVRVSFPVEDPDNETTSGNGLFDLRTLDEARAEYRFPFDTPPHDRAYFEAHMEALANYYRQMSDGALDIQYEVYPRESGSSYQLGTTLKDYGNGRTRTEIAERITRLFRDGIAAADSAEGENLDFGRFDYFAVFHAGLGAEAGQQALNDIPSAFVDRADLETHAGGPVPVDGGTHAVSSGMLLPEAITQDGRGGLNGTLARFLANQLGLPGLSNFEDDLPAVGDWSLMDTGGPSNFSSAARLGLTSLTGTAADTALIGFQPSRMLAWSRARLGWLDPPVVTRDDTVQIVAPHVTSSLPQAVKVPISADEYYLLENRVSRLSVHGRIPEITFSRGEAGGVWLSCDDYDAFIPGSGILVWHVDDTVTRSSDSGHRVNSNPDYRIGNGQYRRGVSLEEADGLEDIGNISADRVVSDGFIYLDTIEGGAQDPYYLGNATLLGPETVPNTDSNLGYPSGISIEVLSPPGDTMTVVVRFDHQSGAWPLTGLRPNGLQTPRPVDLNGDSSKEILRNILYGQIPQTLSEFPIGIDGNPLLLGPGEPFYLESDFASAAGNLITAGRGEGKSEFIWSGASTLYMRLDGELFAVSLDPPVGLPSLQISAPPAIAAFPGPAPTDIWPSSDGLVRWGIWSSGFGGGAAGWASLGDSIVSVAVGNVDSDADNELIALTGSGGIFLISGGDDFRQIGALTEPVAGGPVVADLDRDGIEEAVVVTSDGAVSIFGSDGARWQGDPVPGGASSAPVLGDLDGDGFVEILFGGRGRLWAVRFNGVLQNEAPVAFPLKDETGDISAPPVLGDLDDDGNLDIIVGTRGGLVHGLDRTGTRLPGFPLPTPGPILVSPILDDLDADGTLELVVSTEAGTTHLWHLEDIAPGYVGNRVVWGQQGGGSGNAGRLLRPPVSAPQPASEVLLPSAKVYCYPNPVRENTARIRFFLGGEARVEVTVLNALGEIVERLSSDTAVPGTDNEIRWNTAGYASGLYICRVEARSSERSEVRFVKAAVIR